MYWSDKLGKTVVRPSKFNYDINGAADIELNIKGAPILHSFGAITQADIDAHLGNSSEFTAAQFDATAMGVDAIAFIVDMAGQVDKCAAVKVRIYGSDGALDVEERITPSSLTDSTLASEAEVGSSGNLAIRAIVTGIDALAAGSVELEFEWISK
jgi:hypothetical protein